MKNMSRWWWLPLLALMAAGIARLRFDVEVLNLLPDDIPAVSGLKLYQRHFAGADELLVTIHADDSETAADVARDLCLALRAQTNLVARALWQQPLQEQPGQVPELLATLWLNQPPEIFHDLAGRLAPENIENTLAVTRNALATSLSPEELARLGYDPFGLSRIPGNDESIGGFGQGDQMFASSDGKFRIIFIKPAATTGSYRETGAWLAEVRRAVGKFEKEIKPPSSVRFAYTGAPAFVAEISSGMERDMSGSALGTLVVIGAMFWAAHRRWLPLLWLVVLLVVITAGTLALGGLIFGTLNVVSLGFAAILLGLTVDYGLVLYQEARANPGTSAAAVRRELSGGILWSALTTACAFALLNFAGLPGLGQLGTLVAVGVLLGAVVMLFAFLPLVMPRGSATFTPLHDPKTEPSNVSSTVTVRRSGVRVAFFGTLALAVFALGVVVHRFPALDHSPEALSLVSSAANTAMEELKSQLVKTNEPLWLLVSGKDESVVGDSLEWLAGRLNSPPVNSWFGQATLPVSIWPRPERQLVNRVVAARLAEQSAGFQSALRDAGFTDDAFALTGTILETWRRAANTPGTFTPTNSANCWLFEKCSARTGDGWIAMGIVQPVTNVTDAFAMANEKLGGDFSRHGVTLTGWPVLGEALLRHVEHRLPWVAGVMVLFVGICLWLAFGALREVMLSFAALALSFVLLLALMSLFGWSWNLLNLMVVPLLSGAGVDYTIHVQLAMRRYNGDAAAMRRSTGMALLLCAGTTMAGFGSLAWAGNAGLASLGKLCAAGVACVLFVSVVLLPAWWRVLARGKCRAAPNVAGPGHPASPSSLYASWAWAFGLSVVRWLPVRMCNGIARIGAVIYWRVAAHRRAVVIENLLPVLDGNRVEASHVARRLFTEFAIKVVDLWRFESGTAVDEWLGEWSGWEIFQTANERERGVLFVTPHLGNWEFGGAFMAKKGVKMLVLTQAEPDERLTELRQNSRARWGIETLVVGGDPFAFVEIIKRLNAGATVALLVDRPPAATAVGVELFGRMFPASNAAAELARASGCAVVPVYVVRTHGHYSAQILPEIHYDRAIIGSREARIKLTQEILRAFEPAIRQHPEQWYHFVPVWRR